MRKSDDSKSAAVFDFIDEYLTDVERGRTHALAHYLARYPESQDEIAAEYLALKRSPSDADAPISQIDAAPRSGRAADDHARIGPYRLLRELGRGGQGTVFLAEDTRIARRAAVKILSSAFDTVSDERRSRFRREAELIARLEHPGICGIYDADVDGQTPYIAMRYVEGRTLAEILTEARTETSSGVVSRWPPRSTVELHRVLFLFERAARALHAAHEAGAVHRDVKPGNIIVSLDERPVILDFGLARDEQSEFMSLTGSDEVFGTPAYMSPEQLSSASGELDRRTDVYSLGTALYECLTLRRPFEGAKRAELFAAVQREPVPDPRRFNKAITEDVKVVLETALEKDRARRYPTALEFAEDLRRIREYEPIHARPAGVMLRFGRWTRRHPAVAVSLIGTIVALSAGLTMALILLRSEERALGFARGRQMAERARDLVDEDPSAALAMAIEAVDRAPTYLTRATLFTALEACAMQSVLDGADDVRRTTDICLCDAGRAVAVGFDNGETRVFDLVTGRLLRSLPRAKQAVSTMDCSSSGDVLAVASLDGSVRLFDPRNAELVSELAETRPVTFTSFSPDASRLLNVTQDGRASLWDARRSVRLATLDRGDGGIACAAFSPDGERILTTGATTHPRSSAATLWDAHTGAEVDTFEFEVGALTACAFRPDTQRRIAAVIAHDGSVHLFDVDNRAPFCAPLAHDAPVAALTFSPDGRKVVTTTRVEDEGRAYLWDLARGASVLLKGHDDRPITDVAFSPDGRRFVTGGHDQTLRIWRTLDGTEERSLGRNQLLPAAVIWSDDGRRIASLGQGASAYIWRSVNPPDVYSLAGHTAPVIRVAFSPDGARAITASADGTARLWHTPSRFEESSPHEAGELISILQHDGPLTSASFSASGALVVTTSVDGTARVWDARDGRAIAPSLQHPSPVLAAEPGADERTVLTVCEDGGARLWQRDPAREMFDAKLHFEHAEVARLSPDGSLVATAGDDDAIHIWNAAEGALRLTLTFAHKDREPPGVSDLAWNPERAELAAACADRKIRIFDTSTGALTQKELGSLAWKAIAYSQDGVRILGIGRRGGGALFVENLEHDDHFRIEVHQRNDISNAAFSADGARIATSSRDGTVIVRDAATGTPFVQWRASTVDDEVLWADFSPDPRGERVICGLKSGAVAIWPVDPLPAAKARRPRELMEWEWAREERFGLPLKYR